MISVFHREVDEKGTLIGNYAPSSGNLLPTFCNNLSVPYSGVKNKKNPEDGSESLSRHVGKKLPLLAG